MKSYLENIVGQERVKQTLHNFIQSDLIPHALLFTGPDGVGKENAAIQFAKSLVSNYDRNQSEKTVRAIEQLQEPFIKFIFPLPRGKNEINSNTPTEKLTQDEIDLIIEEKEKKSRNPFYKISIPKANTIKINSIREIKKFLSMNYEEVKYRFVIISEAHLMSDEAQNALLKSLEEPPDKVIFILTTASISELRPTIISRCWRINFNPLSEKDIIKILTDHFHVDRSVAEEVATFANVSVQHALKLIDLEFHDLKEKTISILRYSLGRKFHSAFDTLNSVLSNKSSDNFPLIVSMIITWLNDIQKHRLNFKQFFFKDNLDTLEKFNNKFPDTDINELTSRLDTLSNLPKSNINPSILFANLIFELASVVINKQ